MTNWGKNWKEKSRELWEHEGPDFIRSPKKAALPKWLRAVVPRKGKRWPSKHYRDAKKARIQSGRFMDHSSLQPCWHYLEAPYRSCRLSLCPWMCVGSCANCEQQVKTHWSMRTFLFCLLPPAFHQVLGVAEWSSRTDTGEMGEWKSGSNIFTPWFKLHFDSKYFLYVNTNRLSESFNFLNRFFLTFSFSKHIVEEFTRPSLIFS